MPNEKFRLLYDELRQRNLTSLEYDAFQTKFSDPAKLEKLHGKLGELGLSTQPFDSFRTKFLGEQTAPETPQAAPDGETQGYSFFDDFTNALGQIGKSAMTTVAGAIRAIPSVNYNFQDPKDASQTKDLMRDLQREQVTQVIEGRARGEQDGFLKAAVAIEDAAESALPSDAKYDASIMGQLGSGLGSMAAMAVVPGSGMLAAADEQQQDAIRSGASPETIAAAGAAGMGIGTLEYIPLGRLFKRLDKAGGVSKWLSKKVKPGGALEWLGESVAQGFEEGAQEVISNTAMNLTAREMYDSSRDLLEGSGASFGTGAGVGFIVAALGMSIRRMTPKGKEEIELRKKALENIAKVEARMEAQGPDAVAEEWEMPDVNQREILESQRQELQDRLENEPMDDQSFRKVQKELDRVMYQLWQPLTGEVSSVLNPDTKELEVYNAAGKRVTRGKTYTAAAEAFVLERLRSWQAMGNRVDEAWDYEAEGSAPTMEQLAKRAAQIGENPLELLEYARQMREEARSKDESALTPQDIFIAENLEKVSPIEFRKLFDKNFVTGRLARAWLRKDAHKAEGVQNIEQLLQSAELMGIELTTDDVLRFMQNYSSKGDFYSKSRQSPLAMELRERAKRISGMSDKMFNKLEAVYEGRVGKAQQGQQVEAELEQGLVPAVPQAVAPQQAAPAQQQPLTGTVGGGGNATPPVVAGGGTGTPGGPPLNPNMQVNNPQSNPNIGRLKTQWAVLNFFKKYFTWQGLMPDQVAKKKEEATLITAAEMRRAEDVSKDLQESIIRYYASGFLSALKQRAQTALGLPISTELTPDVDGRLQNTMANSQLWERFTLWLPKEKREYLEKSWGAKVGTAPFQRRAQKAFQNFAAQRANVPPAMQQIFDSFLLDMNQATASTNMYEAINQVLEGRRKISDLPQEIQPAVRAMKEHVVKMEQRLKTSGAVNAEMKPLMDARSGTYVSRSYRIDEDEKWADKIPERLWADAIDLVYRERLKTNPAYTIEEAERYVRQVVDERSAAMKAARQPAKAGRPGSQDRGILMERKDVAPEFRALFGEYRDPQVNYIKTIARMAQLEANYRFLKDIRDAGSGIYFWQEGQQPIGSRKFANVENLDLAPLNGWYTTPELHEALTEMSEMATSQQHYMIASLVKFQAAIKASKTILNPVSAARNFLSGGIMALTSGNPGSVFNLRQISKKLRDNRGYRYKMVELGVIDDSVVGAQIREAYDAMKQDETLIGTGLTKAQAVRRAAGGVVQRAADFYQAADNLWRIGIFEGELKKVVKVQEKALGRQLTPDEMMQAEKEAAQRTRDLYPTYSRASKAVQALKYNPVFSSFPVFVGESIRSYKNIFLRVGKELSSSNPEERKVGAKRLIGLMAGTAIPYSLYLLSKGLQGISDEEEEAINMLAPSWSKASPKFYFRAENGQPKYVDLGWLDPYQFWHTPINQAMFGNNKSVGEWAEASLKKSLAPFYELEIGTKAIIEATTNTSMDRPGNLVNPQDDNQIALRVQHVIKSLEPGIVTSGRNIYDATQGVTTDYGKKRVLADELWAFGGFRMTTIDVEYGVMKGIARLQGDKSQARFLYSAAVKSKNPEKQTAEYLEERYEMANRKFRQIQEKQTEFIDAGLRLGWSRSELERLLVMKGKYGGAGITKKEFDDLYAGRVKDLKE